MSKKLTPAEIALYWFLKSYELEHGKPYTVTTQKRLASDSMLHESTIAKVKNYSKLITITKSNPVITINEEHFIYGY